MTRLAAVRAGASGGYFDYRLKGEGFAFSTLARRNPSLLATCA